MTHETRHINLSDLREVPAWKRLVEEVHSTHRPAILHADGEDLAELRPLARAARRQPQPASAQAADATFWSAAGAWKDLVDAEQLKRDLKAARGSDRLTVTL